MKTYYELEGELLKLLSLHLPIDAYYQAQKKLKELEICYEVETKE